MHGAGMIRILLVDDHPVLLEGLRLLLKQQEGFTICGQAKTADEALTIARQEKPNLIILDFSLAGEPAVGLIRELKETVPGVKVLMYSMHDMAAYADRVSRAGADGYVMKEEAPEILIKAIHEVMKGQTWFPGRANEGEPGLKTRVATLSNRELQVFESLGRGLGVKDVAVKLGLSAKTVETHCASIKRKLSLQNAHHLFQAAARWEQAGRV
jgi:DNA-binding NarL/FixJ family response regulator